ncbi:MAG: CTP synthase [Chloroflexi bacterium]|nr:CTP synthase [Chloroflexota bacterium]
MTQYIFVTGGVVSSLGKGITAASIGRILKARGVTVSIQKLDPYINVDPGTLNPYEHGEVFVTDDGAETDLDLGHYERFTGENMAKVNNVTTGQIFQQVILRERRGDYLGKTIQTVPHITAEIKRRIAAVGIETNAQVVIVEVGGTVGDIEGQPFIEAIRQLRGEIGRDNALYVHVTLLPYLSSSSELKTKPTQHSVRDLRALGIQPDVIVCRSDRAVPDNVKDKIALFCDVERRAVVPLVTAQTIYEVPLMLETAGLGAYIVERLHLPQQEADLDQWRELVEGLKLRKEKVKIAVVGKYVELPDAYTSVREALVHAGLYHARDLDIEWIQSEDLERDDPAERLKSADGIVVPGGFGYRGIEGKIQAARYAREHRVPYLGLCLGLQVMTIELARHALGTDDVNSTEFDERTQHPVIDLMPDQRGISAMGGTMRLGSYACNLTGGTRAAVAYGEPHIKERHRHRWELNNQYRDCLHEAGMVFSGLSPNGNLIEIAELADHPFMVGSQFHPELKSRLDNPHPLFRDFIRAAVKRRP